MNNYAALTPSFHKQVKQELSRRNFIDFVSYTMPTFQQGWFNRIIAAELQQFYFDVMAGKQPRRLTLMWFQRNRLMVDWQAQRQLMATFEEDV